MLKYAMLTSSFIFLCIDLLANCMPTSKPLEHALKNEEIQDHLETILDNPIKHVFTKAPSNMMGPIHIPALTTKKQCAMHRLKEFIKLLDPKRIENEEKWNFQKFYGSLQEFDRLLSQEVPPISLQECETEEYKYHGLRDILEDVRRLLHTLYCIQGHC